MLYYKDISKGLYLSKYSSYVSNNANTVSYSSKTAFILQKLLSNKEAVFWQKLFEIAKTKHQLNYPYYKYNPIRRKKSDYPIKSVKKRHNCKTSEKSIPNASASTSTFVDNLNL